VYAYVCTRVYTCARMTAENCTLPETAVWKRGSCGSPREQQEVRRRRAHCETRGNKVEHS